MDDIREQALRAAYDAAGEAVADGDDHGGQGFIAEAMARNEATIDELVAEFRRGLEDAL